MDSIITQNRSVRFFNSFPKLQFFLRFLFGLIADILLQLGNWVGRLYTYMFSMLGTSWFDHRFDYLKGLNNYHWLERAFMTRRLIKKGDSVLDIGCGDGTYDRIFYAPLVNKVLAIDFDKKAIEHAKKNSHLKNLKFLNKDVTKWRMVSKSYNIVLMFAVIEHLKYSEGINALKNIKKALKADGVFLGSTAIFSKAGVSNREHQNEFGSLKDLEFFLAKVFKNYKIQTSVWDNNRIEVYFECHK